MFRETAPTEVELFLDRHCSLISREARSHARNAVEADDIAQDARLKILRANVHIGKVENPAAWIRTVVRNAAMDHLGKARQHVDLEMIYDIAETHAEADPERIVMARCLLQEVIGIAVTKGFEEFEIVVGIATDQDENQIAQRLGKSKSAVYTTVHRLRRALAGSGYLENRINNRQARPDGEATPSGKVSA